MLFRHCVNKGSHSLLKQPLYKNRQCLFQLSAVKDSTLRRAYGSHATDVDETDPNYNNYDPDGKYGIPNYKTALDSPELLPSDYRELGPYPMVPQIPYQFRPPYGPYDDNQERRNFNEPIPEDYEVLSMWTVDLDPHTGAKEIAKGFSLLGIVLLGAFGIAYLARGMTIPKASPPLPYEVYTLKKNEEDIIQSKKYR